MTRLENLSQLPVYRREINEKFKDTGSQPEASEALNQLTYRMMHAICSGPLLAVTRDDKQTVIVLQPHIVYQEGERKNKLRVVHSKQDLLAKDQIFTLAGKRLPADDIQELKPAETDFHPATKYNAMLIIGDLNDEQPRGKRPAKPREMTLLDLLAYVEPTADHSVPDLLRVAALVGIKRHARSNYLHESGFEDRVGNVMIGIIEEPSLAGRSRDADLWIRRQAIDILGAQGVPGPKSVVVSQLLELLSDQSRALPLRIAAASALGQIDLEKLPNGEVSKSTPKLTKLALDACNFEIKHELAQNRTFSGGRLAAHLEAVLAAAGSPDTEAPKNGGQDDRAIGRGLWAVANEQERPAIGKLVMQLQQLQQQARDIGTTSVRTAVEPRLNEGMKQLLELLEGAPASKPLPQTAESP
jgi:hypothetical protein